MSATFCQFWGVDSLENVAVVCGTDATHIRAALRENKTPNELIASMALVGFARAMLQQWGWDYGGEFLPLLHLSALETADPLVRDLAPYAQASGLDRSLVLGLTAGNKEEALLTAGYSRFRLNAFLESLC